MVEISIPEILVLVKYSPFWETPCHITKEVLGGSCLSRAFQRGSKFKLFSTIFSSKPFEIGGLSKCTPRNKKSFSGKELPNVPLTGRQKFFKQITKNDYKRNNHREVTK